MCSSIHMQCVPAFVVLGKPDVLTNQPDGLLPRQPGWP